MKNIAVVKITCACGHVWHEIVNATDDMTKETVSCPQDGCMTGNLRDYNYVVLLQKSIVDFLARKEML